MLGEEEGDDLKADNKGALGDGDVASLDYVGLEHGVGLHHLSSRPGVSVIKVSANLSVRGRKGRCCRGTGGTSTGGAEADAASTAALSLAAACLFSSRSLAACTQTRCANQ